MAIYLTVRFGYRPANTHGSDCLHGRGGANKAIADTASGSGSDSSSGGGVDIGCGFWRRQQVL